MGPKYVNSNRAAIDKLKQLMRHNEKRLKELSVENQALRYREQALSALIHGMDAMWLVAQLLQERGLNPEGAAAAGADLKLLRDWQEDLRHESSLCSGSNASAPGGGGREGAAASSRAAETPGSADGGANSAGSCSDGGGGPAGGGGEGRGGGGDGNSGVGSGGAREYDGSVASWAAFVEALLDEEEVSAALKHGGISARFLGRLFCQSARDCGGLFLRFRTGAPDAAECLERVRVWGDRILAVSTLAAMVSPGALLEVLRLDLRTLERYASPPSDEHWDYVVQQCELTEQQELVITSIMTMYDERIAAIQERRDRLSQLQLEHVRDPVVQSDVLVEIEACQSQFFQTIAAVTLGTDLKVIGTVKMMASVVASFPYLPSWPALWGGIQRKRQQPQE